MKTAILNSAMQNALTHNLNDGIWLSITHFALAWVSDTEREYNPVSVNMTELVREIATHYVVPNGFSTIGSGIKHILNVTRTASGSYFKTPSGYTADASDLSIVDLDVKYDVSVSLGIYGDNIYNIWQTPFAKGVYAGQFSELPSSLGSKYSYEYDECSSRNVLKYESTPLLGCDNSGTTSDLSSQNMPVELDSSIEANQLAGIEPTTKLFPVKAYNKINSGDDSTVRVNFMLELPPIATAIADAASRMENAIGNFKFNRIGLYAVKTNRDAIFSGTVNNSPITSEEPILFAVIDIGVSSKCGDNSESYLEVFKSRGDEGYAGWQMDVQLPISNAANIGQAEDAFYVDAVRDEATKFYQNQIESTAGIVESVMQLQMMVLQLAEYIEGKTGVNPFVKPDRAGFSLIGNLAMDSEYHITANSKDTVYLSAEEYRGIDDGVITWVNERNSLINLDCATTDASPSDGDKVKITVCNLDGRKYLKGSKSFDLWNGSIMFVNHRSGVRTKIFTIDSSLISKISNAKVTLEFAYSSVNDIWLLIGISIIDESKLYT